MAEDRGEEFGVDASVAGARPAIIERNLGGDRKKGDPMVAS